MKNVLAAVAVAAAVAMSASASAQQASAPADPVAMTRQELRDEVTRLRAVVQNRAVQPQRPAGCTTPEHRQFDFWVGEWDVSPSAAASGVIIAESTIALLDQGCVIIEEWRPFGGAHGHSINSYDAGEGRWRQTWADATGRRTEYAGVLGADGVLRFDDLSSPEAGSPPGRRRMSFQRLADGGVRQWGEIEDAARGTWSVEWDLTYRRRPG